ncbi:MAG: two-component system, OmpR family, phosphate regulon sensor histidine kinase PhoR [Actinomycetota bacterium]|jgi:signal transduction histidine kinase
MTPSPRQRLQARLARRRPAAVVKLRVQASLLLLLLLLAAVLAAGLLSAFSLYRSAENRYIRVVFPLRTATRDLILQMVNEETGVRGYMITLDRKSLTPYKEGRRTAGVDLAEIRKLTLRQPQLSRRLRQLEQEIRALHGYYDQLITFVADSQFGQSVAKRKVLQSERLFDRFRVTSTRMQADLERFVQTTRDSQRHTFLRSVGTLVIAGFLALAIAGTLLFGLPERLRVLYAAEEEARRKAEQGANAARALTHVSDGVVLVDDEARVRSWNTAAERLLGVTAGAAVGRPAAEVIPEYPRLEAGRRDEFVPVRVNDEDRWYVATTTTFDGGRVLTIRDATAAHELERARTEFVATASHELRTPLTSIYGAAQTILGRRDRLNEGQQLQLMRIIEQESAHLAQVVDQLLVTAQINRGRLPIAAAPCDIAKLARTVVEAAEARKPELAELVLDVPERPIRLGCDQSLLRRVLVNLVDNALKYSPDGGRVQVRVVDDLENIRVEVSDEGLGIPAADQERIFERFYRLDAGMSRGVGGSGLGLYISREIVTQMGGTLTVRSVPGAGSTFVVRLPRPEPIPDTAEPLDDAEWLAESRESAPAARHS